MGFDNSFLLASPKIYLNSVIYSSNKNIQFACDSTAIFRSYQHAAEGMETKYDDKYT
jgi:hypothetical protein